MIPLFSLAWFLVGIVVGLFLAYKTELDINYKLRELKKEKELLRRRVKELEKNARGIPKPPPPPHLHKPLL